MSRTSITATQLTINASCTSVAAVGTTDGMACQNTNFAKLFILGYNSDTAVASVVIEAGTSGTDWAGKGIGSLTTSISSSEYRVFGPFESFRFGSTDNNLYIDMSSTSSTKCKFWAWSMP